MGSSEFVVSTEALIRVFVFLLYVPTGLISYWRLFPRLSPTSRRLASGMLAAQILVIVVSLEFRHTSDFDKWVWNLDSEWSIPSTLASTQLALVGGVALVTAWLARARPAWQRLYLVAIGLMFLFLALDEYVVMYRTFLTWQTSYTKLGAAVVLATTIVAMRSPQRTWIWHLCLLTGLSLIAMGAIVFDNLVPYCGNLGFLRLDGCIDFHDPEESLEFLGCWLALLAMLGHLSDAVPTPQPRIRHLLYALPGLCIVLMFFNSLIPRLELRFHARQASTQFESGVHLQGHRIDSGRDASVLYLYAFAKQRDYLGLRYSIQFVDHVSGDSVFRFDDWADGQHGFWLLGPDYAPIYRQRMDVQIRPWTPSNRALWIVLTIWRNAGDGEFLRQKVLASDQQLLNDTQVVLGEFVVPAESAASASVPLANFDTGFTLDVVDMPEISRAGETLTIPFAWRSEEQGREDYIQFLHFGHEESGTWWVYDQQPLGPRLPTRLWYSGLADHEIWKVPLPADLAPGRYTVFTGLYRTRDQQRVPASDAAGNPWLDARVPLGTLVIE